MALYRSGNGYGVDYRDALGRRHRKFVGTEAAARAVAMQISDTASTERQALKNFRSGPQLTASEARDVYLASTNVAPRTRAAISARLNALIAYTGDTGTDAITPASIAEYVAARKLKVAPSTIALELGEIKRWTRFLAQNWYLPADPAANIKNLKITPSTISRTISYDEEKIILESARHPNTRTRILLALDAGARAGETNILRKRHISNDAITIPAPKTSTTRSVPLTPRLKAQLQSRTTNIQPDAFIISSAGRPTKTHSSIRHFIRDTTGIQFRFHDLRHSFASRLAASGAPFHVIRDLLGHTAPRSTTDIYLHSTHDDRKHAIAMMTRANPNAEQKPPNQQETQAMPGKRYDLTITAEIPLLQGRRARIAADQTPPPQPGHVWAEVELSHYKIQLPWSALNDPAATLRAAEATK